MHRLLASLPLVAALVGCLGATTNPDGSAADASAPAEPVTHRFPISFEVGTSAAPTSGFPGAFPVEREGATLLVEGRWSCRGFCALTVDLTSPRGDTVTTIDGDGGAKTVEGAAAGEWQIDVRPRDGVTVGAEGEVAVTALDGPVPDGFTAFPENQA